MSTKTMFLTVLIVFLLIVSDCNGDTCSCTCCTGNFCTPTFQGTAPIASCALGSCTPVCQNTFSQCTAGSGTTSSQCDRDSLSTPNWVGVFNIANRCDTRTCCCPTGQLTLSRVGSSTLRVQMRFTGQCPSEALSMDELIAMPTGFDTQILFLGEPIMVTLSQDSRTILMNNPAALLCSETAIRNEALSLGTINLASVFLLSSLMSFRQFML